MQLLIFDESDASGEAWMYSGITAKRVTNPSELVGHFLTNLPDYQCCFIANEQASFLPFDAFSVSIECVFKAIYGCLPGQGFDERYNPLVPIINRVLLLLNANKFVTGRRVSTRNSEANSFEVPGQGMWVRSIRRKQPNADLKGKVPCTLRALGSVVYSTVSSAQEPVHPLTPLASSSIPFAYDHTNRVNEYYLNPANAYVVEFKLLEPLGEAFWYFPLASGSTYRMSQPEFALLLKSAYPEIEIRHLYTSGASRAVQVDSILVPFTNLSGWLSKYIANEVILDRLLKSHDAQSRAISSLALSKTVLQALQLEKSGFVISSVKAFEINGFMDPSAESALLERFSELGVFVE